MLTRSRLGGRGELREVEIEANHRGYLCDRENVPDIVKDIDVAGGGLSGIQLDQNMKPEFLPVVGDIFGR